MCILEYKNNWVLTVRAYSLLYRMKVFLIVLFAVVSAVVHATEDPVIQKCITETKVNAEKSRAYINALLLPEDLEDFNTFIACCARKKVHIEENGEIDWNKVTSDDVSSVLKDLYADVKPDFVKRLTPEKVKEALQYCRGQNIVGKDLGDKTVKTHNCLVKKIEF